MSGYKLVEDAEGNQPPVIVEDGEGTTSWREVKKALRQWYLDQASKLRTISEKDMFPK